MGDRIDAIVFVGLFSLHWSVIILGNPGTHCTAIMIIMNAVIMNAVGTEWVTPGLPRTVSYTLSGDF